MRLLCFLFAAAAALAGDLSETRTVYILPMASGLDQYLADRLTKSHVLQVVTDPSRATAVFTDRVGPGFEQKMTELYPPPPAPEKPEAAKKEAEKKEAEKTEAKEQPPASIAPMMGDTLNKLNRPMSSFGGGKGTVFLVSVKSREVLWSTFEKPKDSRGRQMEKSASKICDDLKKSISGK